jgi:outer membrane protein assembly factor BamA
VEIVRYAAHRAFVALVVALCLVWPSHARADESAVAAPIVAPPPDVRVFVGKTVSDVDVVITASGWPDVKKPDVRALRPGDVLSMEKVRAALDELLAQGQFADARVMASEDGRAAVRLHFQVTPRRIIDSLRIDLHDSPIDRDEILRESDLSEGGEIIASSVPDLKRRVEALVKKHGFPSPKVTLVTRATDDPRKVLVLLDVDAGDQDIIRTRVFYVVGRRPPIFEDLSGKYAVVTGARADELSLDAADVAFTTLLATRGWWSARVSHDVVTWQGERVLRVRVELGPRSTTMFEGNERFDAAALDGALALEAEPDRSLSHLTQKLRDFYVKRGYLDVEIGGESRVGRSGELYLLAFKIRENPRVFVTARTYPCLREAEVKNLTSGGPRSPKEIGAEIDSFLEEELPGGELISNPRPAGVDKLVGGDRAPLPQGRRARPDQLDPNAVFAPDTYERAAAHVQELYRSEGFLSALVGPVQVVRKRCAPRSAPGRCEPLPLPEDKAPEVCPYDASNLPLPSPPISAAYSCTPDPAKGVECDPRVAIRIPVKLGPRSVLYDLSFRGARSLTTESLAAATGLALGDPVNTVKLDEARRKVLEQYKEEGFAFADVRYTLEPSPDHTRARAHFDIVENERVIVRSIIVRGNTYTDTDVIQKRVALIVEQPYRASLIRKTQERVATLNVFSSVTVGLEDPNLPDRNKNVIVTVVENPRQYAELRPGFSTGEGFRVGFEYGYRNIGGRAIGFASSLTGSFLPTELILDPVAAANYASSNLSALARLGFRGTVGLTFPEIGLGPLIRGGIDGLFVHDLQRDYYITKAAAIPSATFRPMRELQVAFFQSTELNNVRILAPGQTLNDYLTQQAALTGSTDLARKLNVPNGQSIAFAERVVFTWDRRDNPYNASTGTYLVSGVEHVDAYPDNGTSGSNGGLTSSGIESHFVRFTETFTGYIPLPSGMRLAAGIRLGTNVQLTDSSQTYSDRFFFLGGVDSMRGWQQSSFLPQDDVDRVYADRNKPDLVDAGASSLTAKPEACLPPAPCIPNPQKYTVFSRPIRGGNLMFNPKLELRIPIKAPVETAIFTDIGNLWIDPLYPMTHGKFPLRASIGTGLRVQTPVGPLAIDYGLNLMKIIKPSEWYFEDPWAFHFAIGLF